MIKPRHARRGSVPAAVVIAGLVLTVLPGMVAPASAKPPTKPGRVSALSSTATLDSSTYTVHSTWTAAAHATAYQVRLTNATTGAVLDSGRVSSTAFNGTTTLNAGKKVTVTVTALNQTRKGRPTSASYTLPDLTAPDGSYSIEQETGDGNVTLTQVSLHDDVSDNGSITQTIDWGDGTAPQNVAGSTTSVPHTYGATPKVYHLEVTVKDVAGNKRKSELTTVVADLTAPTGSVTVSPASPWARWTPVTFTQATLADNLSAPEDIARTITWGDGSTTVLTGSAAATHVYQDAGTYVPEVTATDEAGNASTFVATSVTVRADTTAPRLRFTLPKVKRYDASNWAKLRGTARDAGTGAKQVRVKAIQRRHGTWYAYLPVQHRWVPARTTALAWKRAGATVVTPSPRPHWSSTLRRVKVGVLVYRARGIDNVGNRSRWNTHRQVITRL